MSLAIFDLDNTLLNGDSDYSWGSFLVEKGIVDGNTYEKTNRMYYEQYEQGNLDIYEFLSFALKPLADNPMSALLEWRKEFMQTKIEPILLPKAMELIEQHRSKNDTLLIITATNRFITEPIASRLGIENLLATEPKMENGQYTGTVEGTPCFQAGKVTRLQQWLTKTRYSLDGSWFYSDSANDIPLLEKVSNPVAVDADDTLQAYAKEKNWRIMSLRN